MAWSGATRDARPDPTVPGGTLGLKSRYGDNGQDSLDPPATQIGSHAEVVDSDYAVSDDGEADGSTAIREDDAEMLGVSISSEQVRMKSAQTPAMEKAIAMESLEDDVEGFVADQLTDLSGAGEEGQRLQMTESRVNQTAQVEAGAAEHTEESMPSPWQAPSTTFLRSDATKSFLRDSFSTSRRRSSSGASTVADSLKRLLPSLSGLNLPKAPNLSSFTFSNWPKDEKSDYDESRRKRSTTLFSSFRTSSPEMADRLERLNLSNGTGHDVTSPGLEQKTQQRPGKQLLVGPDRTTADIKSARSESRPHTIRRATSDSSLFLRRTRSPASTLDDTQRWDNIQDQVNSRFKAIKDSFQDTNIRMPKFPSVNLAALRPDFQYTRAHSDSARSGLTLHDPVTGAYKPTMHLSSGENGLRKEEPQIARVNHPVLNKALAHLVGDVVVLGGYRGIFLAFETLAFRTRAITVPQYDWRLSPHLLSQRLIKFLEGLESNQPKTSKQSRGAYVIAHSLGGLVTRHAINQQPGLFAGVLYAGVPQHCVNILGPLRNGDEVLLSSRVLTAQVNFTLRTSYALLPEDGHCFINKRTGERYDIDFFDAKTWDTYRLSPCIAPAYPAMPEYRRGLIDTVSDNLPSLNLSTKRSSNAPRRERSPGKKDDSAGQAKAAVKAAAADAGNGIPQVTHEVTQRVEHSLEPTMSPPHSNMQGSISTACTIPKPAAMAYLQRTLKETLRFKKELAFQEGFQKANVYPPAAVLYGKSVPTVHGAKVSSREAIKCSDAYQNLAFAAGDGVCLAKAAMIPEGYRVVKGGLVKTDRGHVGLLGDLEAVGECLIAVIEGRNKGIGLGT